jgi:hypothetical protein
MEPEDLPPAPRHFTVHSYLNLGGVPPDGVPDERVMSLLNVQPWMLENEEGRTNMIELHLRRWLREHEWEGHAGEITWGVQETSGLMDGWRNDHYSDLLQATARTYGHRDLSEAVEEFFVFAAEHLEHGPFTGQERLLLSDAFALPVFEWMARP